METRRCNQGHEKVRRPYGWRCPVCQAKNAHARYLREVDDGKRSRRTPKGTSLSTPVADPCTRGHQRVRRPGGQLVCPTCQNQWKNERRKAERERRCEHAIRAGYEGIINDHGELVCLTCLVAEANAGVPNSVGESGAAL